MDMKGWGSEWDWGHDMKSTENQSKVDKTTKQIEAFKVCLCVLCFDFFFSK